MGKRRLYYVGKVAWEMLHNLKGLFKSHTVYLTEVRKEGENIKTFVFKQDKKLDFAAGQYALWFLPQFVKGKPARLFTIAAAPSEDTLQLSTRISDSDFKQKLDKLPLGSKIRLYGPVGAFTLGKQPPAKAVLVAGGIGATPMRSIALDAHSRQLPTKLTLVHSANGYYLYQDEFEKYVSDCHFVTKDTFEDTLAQVVANTDTNVPFYISGPPAFVNAAEVLLKKQHRNNIHKDGFLGY